MKKLVLNAFALLFLAVTTYAGNYELNLRTISDNGATMVVAVEARAVTTTFDVGGNNKGIVLPFTFNNALLTYSTGSINSFFTSFQTKTISAVGNTVTITIEGSNPGAATATLPTSWQEIARATFTYPNANGIQNFVFGTSTFDLAPNVSHTRNNAFDKITTSGASWIGGNGTAGAPATGVADLCKRINVSSAVTVTTGDVRCDFMNISAGSLTIAPNSSITP